MSYSIGVSEDDVEEAITYKMWLVDRSSALCRALSSTLSAIITAGIKLNYQVARKDRDDRGSCISNVDAAIDHGGHRRTSSRSLLRLYVICPSRRL